MAELIEKELQKFDSPEKTEIFFSAHGVPVSYVEQVCAHFQCVFISSTHDALHGSCLCLPKCVADSN